jgi:hypothetical protein
VQGVDPSLILFHGISLILDPLFPLPFTSPNGASSSDASGAAGHDVNPFHVAAPPMPMPIAASSIPLLNIKHHVPEILDLHDSNYASWSSLFELTFCKLGLLDHVDGSVDAQTRLLDVEWTQIDHCIVSWIYLTVSKTIRDMVFHRRATAFSAWNAVRGLFLDNASQRAVYALQDFHSLQQGDLSVHDYCCRLKRLADTLTDVGHPITDQYLIVNTMRDVSSISVPTSAAPLQLHNVLVCPSLIKNLVSVRALTRDNPVTVEFDVDGFSVKDLRTGTVLL